MYNEHQNEEERVFTVSDFERGKVVGARWACLSI